MPQQQKEIEKGSLVSITYNFFSFCENGVQGITPSLFLTVYSVLSFIIFQRKTAHFLSITSEVLKCEAQSVQKNQSFANK